MGAGTIEGRHAIIIAEPRLKRLLQPTDQPDTFLHARQKNDFMLGLVHEAVHLRNVNAGDPRNAADRLREELRAWREVDINVVRPLRRLNQPMDNTFLVVGDAFQACGGQPQCPAACRLIFSENPPC